MSARRARVLREERVEGDQQHGAGGGRRHHRADHVQEDRAQPVSVAAPHGEQGHDQHRVGDQRAGGAERHARGARAQQRGAHGEHEHQRVADDQQARPSPALEEPLDQGVAAGGRGRGDVARRRGQPVGGSEPDGRLDVGLGVDWGGVGHGAWRASLASRTSSVREFGCRAGRSRRCAPDLSAPGRRYMRPAGWAQARRGRVIRRSPVPESSSAAPIAASASRSLPVRASPPAAVCEPGVAVPPDDAGLCAFWLLGGVAVTGGSSSICVWASPPGSP